MSRHVLGNVLVVLQFSLLTVLAVLCALRAAEAGPGAVTWLLWLASVALGLWTLKSNRPGNFNIHPAPKTGGHLVRNGPYRWVRHPMYGSVLLLAAGAVAWLKDLAGAMLWLTLLIVLLVKGGLEERWLTEQYPDYAEYQRGTWRLLPRIY